MSGSAAEDPVMRHSLGLFSVPCFPSFVEQNLSVRPCQHEYLQLQSDEFFLPLINPHSSHRCHRATSQSIMSTGTKASDNHTSVRSSLNFQSYHLSLVGSLSCKRRESKAHDHHVSLLMLLPIYRHDLAFVVPHFCSIIPHSYIAIFTAFQFYRAHECKSWPSWGSTYLECFVAVEDDCSCTRQLRV